MVAVVLWWAVDVVVVVVLWYFVFASGIGALVRTKCCTVMSLEGSIISVMARKRLSSWLYSNKEA